mmetsp:Transcript_71898/g.208245  ORF Transcript_71898/g.208245 Transcript_71898/m.208245 type:complete len:237 (+) Transcript_71898:370-1080(+)
MASLLKTPSLCAAAADAMARRTASKSPLKAPRRYLSTLSPSTAPPVFGSAARTPAGVEIHLTVWPAMRMNDAGSMAADDAAGRFSGVSLAGGAAGMRPRLRPLATAHQLAINLPPPRAAALGAPRRSRHTAIHNVSTGARLMQTMSFAAFAVATAALPDEADDGDLLAKEPEPRRVGRLAARRAAAFELPGLLPPDGGGFCFKDRGDRTFFGAAAAGLLDAPRAMPIAAASTLSAP